MSPTRRDIIKAAGALTVALAFPANVGAEPEFDDSDLPVKDVTIDCVMVAGKMGGERFSILRFDGPVHVTTRFLSDNGKTYEWKHEYQTPALAERVDAHAQSILHVFCNRAGWLGEGWDD